MENPIYEYLMDIVNNEKVSDFHLHADKPLAFRGDGEIKTRENMIVSHDDLRDFFIQELGREEFEKFDAYGDVDFAVQHEAQRFRASGYKMMSGYACVLRVIVTEVPHIDMLGLPPAVHNVLTERDGLVLVTGATGSGKSTRLPR